MKITRCISVLSLILLASCSKNGSTTTTTETRIGEDNGCISRLSPSDRSAMITYDDDTTALALFHENGLSTDSIYIQYLSRYSLYEDGIPNYYITIHSERKINGLQLFNMEGQVEFKNRALNNIILPDAGDTSGLDTISTLKLTQVRALFLKELLARSMNSLRDSCFNATFGYFNTNVARAGTTKLVKAWRVSTASSYYPVAFFKEDGTLLMFDNGFIVF